MADITIRRGNATIRLTGLGDLFKKLQKVSPSAQEAGKRVLTAAAKRVYAKSQALVPVDREDGGQLKASGKVNQARAAKRTGRVTASVIYGGARLALLTGDNPIYAIVQHEDLTLKHDQGQAKFLEKPFVSEQANVMADLAAEIRKAEENL